MQMQNKDLLLRRYRAYYWSFLPNSPATQVADAWCTICTCESSVSKGWRWPHNGDPQTRKEGERRKESKLREKIERQRDDAPRWPSSYSQDSHDKTTKQNKTECHKRDYKEEANIELYSSHSLKFTLKSGIEKALQNRKIHTHTHTHTQNKNKSKELFLESRQTITTSPLL